LGFLSILIAPVLRINIVREPRDALMTKAMEEEPEKVFELRPRFRDLSDVDVSALFEPLGHGSERGRTAIDLGLLRQGKVVGADSRSPRAEY